MTLSRFLHAISVVIGVVLGWTSGSFARILVSDPIKLGLTFAAILAAVWLFLWLDELFSRLTGRVLGRFWGVPKALTTAGRAEEKWLNSAIFFGFCVGLAVSLIVNPSDLQKLMR